MVDKEIMVFQLHPIVVEGQRIWQRMSCSKCKTMTNQYLSIKKLNKLVYNSSYPNFWIIRSYQQFDTRMGNTDSTRLIETLEMKIYDRFILLTTNMARITSFESFDVTEYAKGAAAIQNCKNDINTAKQTFASKQNIDTIDEKYFSPIIYNLHSLRLKDGTKKLAKYRTNCDRICREIANLLRQYLILTQNKENVGQ